MNHSVLVRWATLLICVGFLIKETSYVFKLEGYHFTDVMSENLTVDASKRFIREGWKGALETGFLPVYQGFRTHSPVFLGAKEDHVYTHFFPGPEYVLTPFLAIFGTSDRALAAARFIPILAQFFAILLLGNLLFSRVFGRHPWSRPAFLLWVFIAPAIYAWGANLYGHVYSTVCIMLAFALGLMCGDQKVNSRRLDFFAALVGFISIYMLLEGVFSTAAAPLVASLLVSHKHWKKGFRLSVFVGVGCTIGYLLHFVQIAVALNDFGLAWLDQFGTAEHRSVTQGGYNRIQMLGRYSKHVGNLFRTNGLTMLFVGGFACWLHFRSSQQRIGMGVALFLSCIAGFVFPMIFRLHSVVHDYRVPRAFVLMFLAYITIMISLFVNRDRADSGVSSNEGGQK